jgi:hypothetical protein
MIVSVTRNDLRDEFIMADEAFALSPISARATQPREEDYDAISEAFMETSRGRWFLGEYAKRNRNADTRMVLDAVARIEENLAAQKQPAAGNSGLAEALAAIRGAVEEARTAAAAAIDGLALEEALAPVRKGARVIKEIAWRWREIGADGRICDLIDSQVIAIEGACGHISSADPRAALSAAFDLLRDRLEEFGGSGHASALRAAEAPQSPPPPPSEEMLAAVVETAEAAATTGNAGAAMAEAEAMIAEAEATKVDTAETPAEAAAEVKAEAVATTAETGEATAKTAELASEAADAQEDARDDAHDEAVLDLVALEMAAPDPSDADDLSDVAADEVHLAESSHVDLEIVAKQPEPMEAPPAIAPTIEASLQPQPARSPESVAERAPEASLGSALIASGLVQRKSASGSDPLAPIRRMSQAEKVAFFS